VSVRLHTAYIRRWLKRATPKAHAAGRAWYREARRFVQRLADSYGVAPNVVAGIVAALSPRQSWKANKSNTITLVRARVMGDLRCPRVGLGTSRRNAWRIAWGTDPEIVLHGRKTRAFYFNLLGNMTHVTVDMWAMKAAGHKTEWLTESQHQRIVDAYRAVAQETGLDPAVVQAVVWVTIRGSHL